MRGDKRLSSGEQNGNLCSDQRASLWRQEGGRGGMPRRRCEELPSPLSRSQSESEPLFCVTIKERGEISGFLGLKRPLGSLTELTRGSDVLNMRVKCQRVGWTRTSCHRLVTSPDSRDPPRWFYWRSKENGPNTEELSTDPRA